MADDLNPAPWLRGTANTTFEQWEFAAAPGVSTVADPGYFNPNGIPTALSFGTGYVPTFDGRSGVLSVPSSGILRLDIPNTGTTAANTAKALWVQLTWEGTGGSSGPLYVAGGPGVSSVNGPTLIEDDPIVGQPLWHHTTYLFGLTPNPTSEFLYINNTAGALMVDEVVVDTLCYNVPEPSTWVLLSVGASLLLVRRWRQKR